MAKETSQRNYRALIEVRKYYRVFGAPAPTLAVSEISNTTIFVIFIMDNSSFAVYLSLQCIIDQSPIAQLIQLCLL